MNWRLRSGSLAANSGPIRMRMVMPVLELSLAQRQCGEKGGAWLLGGIRDDLDRGRGQDEAEREGGRVGMMSGERGLDAA